MASNPPSATNSTRVAPQGGVLEDGNPSVYSASNPVQTLIIQVGVIIIFCRLLHFPLSKIRQPRVIAEVIGGILLGPTVMGRVPGFTAAIFPAASIPTLSAVANVGLILYLFLVGLETDLRFVSSNWRVATSVGVLGMVIPFVLGIGIATGLYSEFRGEPGTVRVSFGVFLLFVGVAMAITAFPVLCRILTELKLLRSPVGVIVLSAGVGNDVVGWILLALCVALVNAGSGLSALWIFLVAVGYCLLLFYAIRPAFVWLLRRTGALQNGPSQSIVALTVLMVLASAFFTGIIGIHPIFGGFMIGLICPHEGGFAVKVTEKIEDLVSVLFLPIYFALSGLNTNIGLLNNGITWGYVIGVLAIAFFGKIAGGTIAARVNGLVWRESLTIGTLMSCKGLVELIVLNIGLQAKILSTRTFTIFVVMALLTTFATTPLVSWLYPPWYQLKLEAWKRGEINWDDDQQPADNVERSGSESVYEKTQKAEVTNMLAYLRLDNLPGMLTLVSLLARPAQEKDFFHHEKGPSSDGEVAELKLPATSRRSLQLHGVRLSPVTDRESSVMRVTELDEFANRDPVLNTVTAFGLAKNLAVSGAALICPEGSFSQSVVERAKEVSAELMLLPWSESGAISEVLPDVPTGMRERFGNGSFSNFISHAVTSATCPVGVFVDNNFGTKREVARPDRRYSVATDKGGKLPSVSPPNQGHHIFLPFFGSDDDRFALRLVLQFAKDPSVTATIVYFDISSATAETTTTNKADGIESGAEQIEQPGASIAPTLNTDREASAFFNALRNSLPEELESRVVFKRTSTTSPAASAIETTLHEISSAPKNAGDLVVLGRNEGAAGLDAEEHVFDSDARKALGNLAGGLLGSSMKASLLVVRAPGSSS